MTGLFVFILGFLAAEGIYATLTGRSILRRKLGLGRGVLYDDIEKRTERIIGCLGNSVFRKKI